MQTILVTIDISLNDWCTQYRIAGWKNPAGEVYDLKNGRYLALYLSNSCSTDYQRKAFKSLRTAKKWIEKRLQADFPCDTFIFELAL